MKGPRWRQEGPLLFILPFLSAGLVQPYRAGTDRKRNSTTQAMNFTIGSKIVCVDASPPPAGHSICGPELERGKVYCVTEVDPPWSARDPGGVRIIGPLCFTAAGDESWWRADRFRRLEDVQAENQFTHAGSHA